ncbi:hypothetical protein HA520_06030 [Azotobacter chroococcum]|uniref:Phosphotransferase system, HPr-related protein n=1 Tax=Azotobacter chroococcum TaxID=353 RepID=A0AA43Z5Z6_9GAMM|nr:hypothetical protein [Azotobacter chroococcum]NHN76846.1 hypothetical protein [Azotobacter chroococcum]
MKERKPQTQEIDDLEDRMGSLEPLDFSSRRDERQGRIGDTRPAEEEHEEFPPERVREAGMTGGETPDGEPTMNDADPEILTPEDGARSPNERGHGLPADKDLSIVSAERIGAGGGLDEAEAARILPLDGQPWDGRTDTEASPDEDEEENEEVLSDEELKGPEPLHSSRDREP